MTDKKQLRAHYKQLRRSIMPQDKLQFDADICRSFLESSFYKNCSQLLIYVSFDIEVGTLDMIKQAVCEKQVFCPRCVAGTNIMEFYMIESFSQLKVGSYGILEPFTDTDPQTEFSSDSVCVVPALSYDKKGHRLGFGKGYYDRFLSDFKGTKVGICYDSFCCDELPYDSFDICVDHLITESRCVSFGLRKEEIYG